MCASQVKFGWLASPITTTIGHFFTYSVLHCGCTLQSVALVGLHWRIPFLVVSLRQTAAERKPELLTGVFDSVNLTSSSARHHSIVTVVRVCPKVVHASSTSDLRVRLDSFSDMRMKEPGCGSFVPLPLVIWSSLGGSARPTCTNAG